jgi:PTH1 family peptidyl-tRNA hydrolase
MHLIVGLGNPGHEFELTRHNAGFDVLDTISTISGGDWKSVKTLQSLIIKTQLSGRPVLLAKPTTYMNESGRAVAAILQWFKVDASQLIIIHDDVSLPLGRLRIQLAGGAGGQHGVESIIANLAGEKNFARIKIGVGPDPGGAKRAAFVLKKIATCEQALYRQCIEKAAEALLEIIRGDVTKSMNKYNGLTIGTLDAIDPTP